MNSRLVDRGIHCGVGFSQEPVPFATVPLATGLWLQRIHQPKECHLGFASATAPFLRETDQHLNCQVEKRFSRRKIHYVFTAKPSSNPLRPFTAGVNQPGRGVEGSSIQCFHDFNLYYRVTHRYLARPERHRPLAKMPMPDA